MTTATVAATGATGARAWLGTRSWTWVTPPRLRWMTVALCGVALVVVATLPGAG
jgi:hypothetical protein